MKTITNIIIINSQNVKSEYVVSSLSKHQFLKPGKKVSVWTSSTEVASTRLPKLPLDDLKSLTHRLA